MPKRIILDHPIGRLVGFSAQTPQGEYEFIRLELPDWVNVVAVTTSGQFVLVRQHRWGTDSTTLEIPGGMVDDGEDALTAGRRELLEETGFGGGRVRSLGHVRPNPAIQDNTQYAYLIEGVERLREPAPDPTEAIEVVLASREEVVSWLAHGAIDHALAVLSLERALYVPYHEDI